jgi:hypothetical protein
VLVATFAVLLLGGANDLVRHVVAVVLGEVQRRFAVPFQVVDGGLREGVALSVLASLPAAA